MNIIINVNFIIIINNWCLINEWLNCNCNFIIKCNLDRICKSRLKMNQSCQYIKCISVNYQCVYAVSYTHLIQLTTFQRALNINKVMFTNLFYYRNGVIVATSEKNRFFNIFFEFSNEKLTNLYLYVWSSREFGLNATLN